MATKKTFSIEADGELVVAIDNGQNADGTPALARRAVRPEQFEAHLRDPDFLEGAPDDVLAHVHQVADAFAEARSSAALERKAKA